MSQEQSIQNPAVAPRRRIPIRIERLKATPALNMLGIAELIALVLALFLALITIFSYFYFYLPAQSRAKSMDLEQRRLLGQLQASTTEIRDKTQTRESVDKITASLNDFEDNYLSGPGAGRMSLYTVLNDLIRSNGLRNTAGPSYSPLEPIGTKRGIQPTISAEKQSNAKWQTIYPGIAVSVTVEGPYQNIRRFVRDIETSRTFLIINAVELERVTQSNTSIDQSAETVPAPARGSRPGAIPPAARPIRGNNALVSLRMDLATYFQRSEPKAEPTP
ncbi:MAG TPA: GspMb/PilO family protein [Pyrinomonadaceae bacterium]|nr:GspMb/PilO family protein [Pyrinomonadaceae bacterium]